MLPSLSALSLEPTGANDDVVREIMDEREDEWEDAVVWGLRGRYAAEKRAAEAQEAWARKRYRRDMATKKLVAEMEQSLAQKAEAASEAGYASVGEYEKALDAAEKAAAKAAAKAKAEKRAVAVAAVETVEVARAAKMRAHEALTRAYAAARAAKDATAKAHEARMRAYAEETESHRAAKAARVEAEAKQDAAFAADQAREEAAKAYAALEAAAAAEDSSGYELYEEPEPPLIYKLEPGPFSVIVDELVKRLAPDAEAINGADADAMCRDVANVCRELATLNRLPGQAVDPKYDCSDPNAEIWRLAHAIFGVNPRGKLWLRGKKPNQLSWKANFVLLCKAFRPDFDYPKITWEAAHGGGIRHGFFSVWNLLWRTFPENRQAAREWNQAKFEEDAREAFLDEGDEDFDSDDSDYDEDAAFEAFKERFGESAYYGPTLHSPEPEELKALRAKIRLPIKPGSAQIQWRVDNMMRLSRMLNKGGLYDLGNEPEERRIAHEDERVAHRELLPKVEALQRLFRTLREQARAMQNAAS